MRKIPSTVLSNFFITKFGYHEVKQATCEMSTLGSFAYKNDKLIFNEYGGNLIRIKRAE